ncbi:MAG: ZIP family metal transporter [Gemmatimonadetes bacterium]|nr:ZIP family metal transporter [Gemmatimonadota bacterium]
MSPWVSSLAVVALVSALPLLGITVFAQRPQLLGRHLGRLVPLAAGALVGAPLFHLIPEALAKGGASLTVMGWMAVGGSAFFVMDRLLHARVAPAGLGGVTLPGEIAVAGPARMRELVPLLVVGDALHNAVDGILIAGAYLDEPTLGIVTGVAIALHELPRELGTVALLLAAGMTMRRAVALNVATAVLAAVSAIATLVLGAGVVSSSGVLLALGAGTFIYLAGALILSEWRSVHSRNDLAMRVALFAAGLLLTTLGRHTH